MSTAGGGLRLSCAPYGIQRGLLALFSGERFRLWFHCGGLRVGSVLTRYSRVIAAVLLLAHLMRGLNMFGVAPLLPLVIQDFEISRAAAGLLVSLPMLVAAAFGIPGGMLVARIGVRRALIVGWAATSLLTLSFLAPDFVSMLALRLAFGVGFALIVTATGPLLMGWFAPRGALVVNSFNTVFLSLGVTVSVVSAVPLAQLSDWKMALTLFGTLGVLGCVIWLWAGRDSPAAGPGPAPISLVRVASVLRTRTVVLLIVADAGILIQYAALTSWLPSFYNEQRGLSLSEAGFVTGVLPFVGIFAVLAGGALPLRVGSARAFFIASGLLAGVGGLGTFLMTELPLIYVSVAALGVGSWFYIPTLLTLPLRLEWITPEYLAVIYGSIMTFSGIAMFLSPILVGAMRDVSGSFLPGFLVCAVPGWAVLMAGLLLPREVASKGNYIE